MLRDGEYRGTYPKSELTVSRLISLMVGRSADDGIAYQPHELGETILEVKNLSRADGRAQDASFYLRKGEILGFAGLVGAGRTELMQMLFGLEQPSAGEIILNGERVAIKNVREAIAHGMADGA